MRERIRDKARLSHILEACDIILEAMDENGFDVILANPLMYYGLVKNIEIIGEAVYMLTKEFKKEHVEVSWQEIEDLRHVLVHDYYRINPHMLRPIVETDIPGLRPVIQSLYDAEP